MPIRCTSRMTLGTLSVQVEAQLTVTVRHLAASFGDGYEERRPDGINIYREMWSISTPPMAMEDLMALEYELILIGIGSFVWTPPGEPVYNKRWVLDPVQHTRNYQADDLASLSFSIRRTPG